MNDRWEEEYDMMHRDMREISLSASTISTSDSTIAIDYARMISDRMQKDNIDKIDKNYIAGMIYAVLMKDDIPIKKQQLFKDEEFEI
jgi:hypothetical protein